MGKGSNRRNEDIKKVWDNWDTIFGKKDKQEESNKEQLQQDEPTSEPTKENAK